MLIMTINQGFRYLGNLFSNLGFIFPPGVCHFANHKVEGPGFPGLEAQRVPWYHLSKLQLTSKFCGYGSFGVCFCGRLCHQQTLPTTALSFCGSIVGTAVSLQATCYFYVSDFITHGMKTSLTVSALTEFLLESYLSSIIT